MTDQRMRNPILGQLAIRCFGRIWLENKAFSVAHTLHIFTVFLAGFHEFSAGFRVTF